MSSDSHYVAERAAGQWLEALYYKGVYCTMGVSIQFESERVELWAIYAMERDDDVLEFYDQSSRIPLSYRAKSGHKTTQWHTPDFFVLRRTSAGWEEW